MKATALAALAACCSLLPLAALAEHTVTTKQEKDVCGRMNANLFVHHFTTKVESESYMGTNEQNTRCVKWGTARLFGEERKCVLVDPKDSVRYKVTVGPSSGILYWQRIDFTGRVIKDITTGSGNQVGTRVLLVVAGPAVMASRITWIVVAPQVLFSLVRMVVVASLAINNIWSPDTSPLHFFHFTSSEHNFVSEHFLDTLLTFDRASSRWARGTP